MSPARSCRSILPKHLTEDDTRVPDGAHERSRVHPRRLPCGSQDFFPKLAPDRPHDELLCKGIKIA